ncbi:hypothetical protein QFC20_003818 [Naganishia adeliensis]|uniref:Uncharacterized protein n=1 Tax=Naganishia adeliensis TaxID=92952 RepID=A0ACC2W5T4_9TREE|nr:hypothetical protein QFC20_003818 [Naganishia adeliensis]
MYWPTILTCLALVSATPIKRAPGTFNIRPSGATSFCLGTTQAPANGVALYNIPCTRPAGSDPAYLNFDFEPTIPGVVRLSGTNFCVDSGLGFNELKLWTCLPGVAQQNWVFTGDNHLALYGGANCVSFNGGGCGLGGCAPGTIRCGPDQYQVWTLTAPNTPPPTSTTAPPPAATGTELHWAGPTGQQCLGLTIRAASDGTIVNMGACLPATDGFKGTQLWNIPAKNSAGPIRLAGSNQCLDAGDRPLANGRILKTWTCYPGLYQQTWYRTADDHLAIVGDTVCMDVQREQPSVVQTWQCSGGDPQQGLGSCLRLRITT